MLTEVTDHKQNTQIIFTLEVESPLSEILPEIILPEIVFFLLVLDVLNMETGILHVLSVFPQKFFLLVVGQLVESLFDLILVMRMEFCQLAADEADFVKTLFI